MLNAPHKLGPNLARKATRPASKQGGWQNPINSPQGIFRMMGAPTTVENTQDGDGAEIQHRFGDINLGDTGDSAIDHLRGPFPSSLSMFKNGAEIGQGSSGHALNITNRNSIKAAGGFAMLLLDDGPEVMSRT